MASAKHKPSPRSQAAWKRLSVYYGADVIERKYGIVAPPEWCRLFDRLDRENLGAVLAETKSKHPSYPPTHGEFEEIVKALTAPPPTNDGPSTVERLKDYVLRTRGHRLTGFQLRAPWEYLYQGKCGRAGMPASEDHATTAVIVPPDPDGKSPGFKVTTMDMEAGL